MKSYKKEDEKPEDLLRGLLHGAEQDFSIVISQSREFTRISQDLTDAAHLLGDILNDHPEVLNIETQIEFWEATRGLAKLVMPGLADSMSLLLAANSTGGTASSDALHSLNSSKKGAGFYASENSGSIKNFLAYMERPQIKFEAREQLKYFDFQAPRKGVKNPLEQFNLAYQAYDAPVSAANPVASSLLPMRACLKGIIDILLREIPQKGKKPTNYSKAYAIGLELRYDEIKESTVAHWAEDYSDLINELSLGKEGDFSRDTEGQILQKATIFLKNFLLGLDPIKFRNN